MYTVLRAKSAQDDIKTIARHIAKDSPQNALNFIESLLESAKTTLSVFPESGAKYESCYLLPYRDYCIFYDIDHKNKTVKITHIKNAAQYNAYKHLMK
ncbi:MAG: type II toxin-antitoxin system RelE/ParE family toxin [Psychrosphaera sp.]|nr:type II toxin-antitoxin system RelE/ParE family toxin [Psychrosphaera sp.]